MNRGKTDHVRLFTDGGARGNPGPSAIGILITDKQGNELHHHAEFIGHGTNNRAEYAALVTGLKLCRKFTRKRVYCYSDSQLMINQLNGEYKIKHKELRKHAARVKELAAEFERVTYKHVRREDLFISKADRLLNEILDEL